MNDEVNFLCPIDSGFTFEETITLTEEDISTFAKLCGDMNPLHHDKEEAKASRFGDIIASGPQSSSLFLGTIATNIAPGYLALGMSVTCDFKAPIRPDTKIHIHWLVTNVMPKPKLNGYIATIEGGIYHQDQLLLDGKATCLILKK